MTASFLTQSLITSLSIKNKVLDKYLPLHPVPLKSSSHSHAPLINQFDPPMTSSLLCFFLIKIIIQCCIQNSPLISEWFQFHVRMTKFPTKTPFTTQQKSIPGWPPVVAKSPFILISTTLE